MLNMCKSSAMFKIHTLVVEFLVLKGLILSLIYKRTSSPGFKI